MSSRAGPTAQNDRRRVDGFEVVVVGGGGSGLAAAIAAAEQGAHVAVLEKAPSLCGSTGRSIGSIAVSGTPEQRALGVIDSPEEHAEDYLKIAGAYADREDPELVRTLTENVTATYGWLRGLGMEFFGPVPDPGHRLPRLHNILPTSQSYIHHLAKRAKAVGVQVFLGVGGDALEQDPKGRVSAVRTLDAAGRVRVFTARSAVVLASGDFSNGAALKREFISDEVAGYVAVNPFAQGDGQRMARLLGAQIVNGDVFDVPSLRFMPPPSEGLYGVLPKLPPGRALTKPIKWGLSRLPPTVIRALLTGFVTTYLSPDVSMFSNGAILVDADGQLHSDTSEPIPVVTARLGERGGYLVGDRDQYEMYSGEPHHVATAPGVARPRRATASATPSPGRCRPGTTRGSVTWSRLAPWRRWPPRSTFRPTRCGPPSRRSTPTPRRASIRPSLGGRTGSTISRATPTTNRTPTWLRSAAPRSTPCGSRWGTWAPSPGSRSTTAARSSPSRAGSSRTCMPWAWRR